MIQKKAVIEKRRNTRIDTTNTVGYALFDTKKKRVGKGKGRTINLSQTGTLLQTEKKLKGAFIILIAIDLDGNKVQVNGKVIASRTCNETENFLTGIEFVGPKDSQLKAIVTFVKAYQRRKHMALDKRV